jgi:hypothetical protein
VDSISTIMARRIDGLRADVRELVLDRSGIHPLDTSAIAWVGPGQAWDDLDSEGRRLQSRLLRENDQLQSLVQALLQHLPNEARSQLSEGQSVTTDVIDQSALTWFRTTTEAFDSASRAFDTQLGLLADRYDPEDADRLYVPDTNALLWNPDLDTWRFGPGKFTVVICATVLGELDELKVTHRVPDVREKAESIIRRLKSYRSRGELTRGVTLARNVSTVRTSAVEPKSGDALPWLDADNNDDRIIASFIELAREHPRTNAINGRACNISGSASRSAFNASNRCFVIERGLRSCGRKPTTGASTTVKPSEPRSRGEISRAGAIPKPSIHPTTDGTRQLKTAANTPQSPAVPNHPIHVPYAPHTSPPGPQEPRRRENPSGKLGGERDGRSWVSPRSPAEKQVAADQLTRQRRSLPACLRTESGAPARHGSPQQARPRQSGPPTSGRRLGRSARPRPFPGRSLQAALSEVGTRAADGSHAGS